jgi:hypothetical protein
MTPLLNALACEKDSHSAPIFALYGRFPLSSHTPTLPEISKEIIRLYVALQGAILHIENDNRYKRR